MINHKPVDAKGYFSSHFTYDATFISKAPGRGNIIGEHTDYNHGYVMPFALDCYTEIAALPISDADMQLDLVSTFDDKVITRALNSEAKNHWSDYVVGSMKVFSEAMNVKLPSMQLAVDSNIPTGAGVSSSAALEVATIKLCNDLMKTNLTNLDIAKLAQKAENEYVGMPCGIMDQMACAIAQSNQALFIDTKDYQYQAIELPATWLLVLINSGTKHALVDGAYEERREQCFTAASMLGYATLREASIADISKIDALPELISKRAKHVVFENQRVLNMLDAIKNNDIIKAGQILNQGHLSEKELFEITVPQTDKLVEDLNNYGAYGARQVGGGFGGSVLAILDAGRMNEVWQKISALHPNSSLI